MGRSGEEPRADPVVDPEHARLRAEPGTRARNHGNRPADPGSRGPPASSDRASRSSNRAGVPRGPATDPTGSQLDPAAPAQPAFQCDRCVPLGRGGHDLRRLPTGSWADPGRGDRSWLGDRRGNTRTVVRAVHDLEGPARHRSGAGREPEDRRTTRGHPHVHRDRTGRNHDAPGTPG